MISFSGVRNISCMVMASKRTLFRKQPLVGHAYVAGGLRKVMQLCVIACGLLTFFAVTSVHADENNDRKINSFLFWTMVQLNMQARVCSEYISIDAASINQKMMQYWHAKDGALPPSNVFDEGVGEIRKKLDKIPTEERQRACREGLRESVLNYTQMRELFLYRKLDKGILPPSIEPETVGLQFGPHRPSDQAK